MNFRKKGSIELVHTDTQAVRKPDSIIQLPTVFVKGECDENSTVTLNTLWKTNRDIFNSIIVLSDGPRVHKSRIPKLKGCCCGLWKMSLHRSISEMLLHLCSHCRFLLVAFLFHTLAGSRLIWCPVRCSAVHVGAAFQYLRNWEVSSSAPKCSTYRTDEEHSSKCWGRSSHQGKWWAGRGEFKKGKHILIL